MARRQALEGRAAELLLQFAQARLRVFSYAGGWVHVGQEESWGWVCSGLVNGIR
jgi:hypothetical protein